MAIRSIKKRRLRKYSIGDMRERITLHSRSIKPPSFNSASFSESYGSGITAWARVESLTFATSMQSHFSNVNVDDGATDLFVIRHRAGVTTETIIRWKGNAYEITNVVDIDRRGMYTELRARIKGDQSKDANT